MLAKLGFILLVFVFGILSFVAGVFAPAPWVSGVKQAMVSIPGLARLARPDTGKPAQAESSKVTAVAADVAVKDKKPEPVPSAALLIPTPVPAKGNYALRGGEFSDKESADAVAAQATARLTLPVAVIATVAGDGSHRWVVGIGNFPNLDDARTARIQVNRDLGISDPLPLIALPSSLAGAPS